MLGYDMENVYKRRLLNLSQVVCKPLRTRKSYKNSLCHLWTFVETATFHLLSTNFVLDHTLNFKPI